MSDNGSALPTELPAFPTLPGGTHGMMLRDYLAGQAMVGLLGSPCATPAATAALAYGIADAMLRERAAARKPNGAVTAQMQYYAAPPQITTSP
jgi:hypothetical protein